MANKYDTMVSSIVDLVGGKENIRSFAHCVTRLRFNVKDKGAVDIKAIEAADWSLTPGRYVGVAPEEVDEDFDFEEALRDIHIELQGLNSEAAELAEKIARNFEELGV